MEKNIKNSVSTQKEDFFIDYQQLWTLFKANWKWFPISIISCLVIAGLYLWFVPTTVTITGKMELIDKSKNGGSSMSAGLTMLNSLPLGLGSSLGGSLGGSFAIDAEKEILKSNTLVRKVVKDLNLYTEYRLSKWGRNTLLYQDNPVFVTLDPAHVEWLDSELPLTFHQIKLTITKGPDGYTVETQLKENKEKTNLPSQTFASLPATIKTDAGTLTLTENKLPTKQAKDYENGYTLKVKITPPAEAANDFIKCFTVDPPTKKVLNMLSLSLTDENVIRGIDFINHLVEAYNNRANDEKNEEARKTDEFVNARLAKIDAELGSSDAAWENSKKNFQVTAPEVDAEEVMTKKSLYETQLVEIGTQLQLHDYLSEFVNDPDNLFEFVPLSLGASGGEKTEGAVGTQNASLIQQHNNMVNQRKDLLKSMSERSPQVQRLTQSIRELQPNIMIAMKRDRESLLMKKRTIEREYDKYMGRVGAAPKMERVLTEIGRQREIKQGVYLLMLQKREETAMELANTTDKGKLVDQTTLVKGSDKPKKMIVLSVAIFLGAIFPMGVFSLFLMFKQTIDSHFDLEPHTKLPLLAEIPLNDNGESIRTARTNLLLNLKEGQKVILVTSVADGDGKTFIAKKLEESLVAIGKTVTLVNADFRSCKPSSVNCKPEQAHPADILASADFSAQIADAKSSKDFVILDSPAISRYTDAYQLATFADATLYIVKAGQTKKSVIASLTTDKKLPKPMLVLNSVK